MTWFYYMYTIFQSFLDGSNKFGTHAVVSKSDSGTLTSRNNVGASTHTHTHTHWCQWWTRDTDVVMVFVYAHYNGHWSRHDNGERAGIGFKRGTESSFSTGIAECARNMV